MVDYMLREGLTEGVVARVMGWTYGEVLRVRETIKIKGGIYAYRAHQKTRRLKVNARKRAARLAKREAVA